QHTAKDRSDAQPCGHDQAAEHEVVARHHQEPGTDHHQDHDQRPLPPQTAEPTRRSRAPLRDIGEPFPDRAPRLRRWRFTGHGKLLGVVHRGYGAQPVVSGVIPALRSAASTTFVSSSARVIGPTPPGIGARNPATSATPGATSPTTPSSVRVPPTSTTAAPGLTMSGVMSPAEPAAATTMSARRVCAARSLVPVWHCVTDAFSKRLVISSPKCRPTVTPRPTTQTSAPAIGTS